MRLSTDELVRLAPKLRAYPRTPTPTWPDIVDTAHWLFTFRTLFLGSMRVFQGVLSR
jgi:hypothetical protein